MFREQYGEYAYWCLGVKSWVRGQSNDTVFVFFAPFFSCVLTSVYVHLELWGWRSMAGWMLAFAFLTKSTIWTKEPFTSRYGTPSEGLSLGLLMGFLMVM